MKNAEIYFYNNPIFKSKDFKQYLLNQGLSSKYAQKGALEYYLKIGKIVSLRRDCYAVINPCETPENFTVDYYLLTCKLTEDVILAYHTALELHGFAYSTFYTLTYLSHHRNRPFHFRESTFKAIPFPKELRKKRKEQFGVIHINREGVDIKITNLERTIVDVLDRMDLAGGWDEVWRSIDTVTVFNVQEAVDYALLLGNTTTIAKLGYYLEQRPKLLAVDQKLIHKLEKNKPAQPHYISRKKYGKNKYLKRWNLIVPEELINRSWEKS